MAQPLSQERSCVRRVRLVVVESCASRRKRVLHLVGRTIPAKQDANRTQQRHLEYLVMSLQTLANNDWGSHSSSSISDNEEEPGRGLVRSRHRKLQQRSKRRIRKYLGVTVENQQGASLLEVLLAAPTTVSRYRGHLEPSLQWADD